MSVQHTPKSEKKKTEKEVKTISEQLREQKKKEDCRSMEENMKILVTQRGAVKRKLTRIRSALEDEEGNPNPNLKNVHFLQLHLRTVESCYQEYNEFQNKVYSLPLSDEKRNEQERCYIEFENIYNELSIRLNSLLAATVKEEARLSLLPVGVPRAAPTAAPIHLPPLKVPLPSFDGTYENWFSFKCMFQTIMARYETESPAIKLFHLRNSLTGKAAGIIDQDIINNNDYAAAWAILTERFEDKRLIIDKHIEALFSLSQLTKESAVELRKMVDTCSKNIDALKNLDLPALGLGEQMVVNVMAARMDKETRKAWETHQTPGELPTYCATIDFLKERCKILEKIDTNQKSIKENPKSTRVATRSNTLVSTVGQKCPKCQNSHELWKCEEFKKCSVSEKYDILRKTGSCFNCLLRGHRTNECPSSGSCKQCGKRHHTQLHVEDKKPDSAKKSESEHAEERQPRSETAHSQGDVPRVETATFCTQIGTPINQTLLSTAVVIVSGLGGAAYPCRVLLDSASQTHFVTEKFANLLAVQKDPVNYSVSGLNQTDTRIRFKVHLRIKSRTSSLSLDLDALVAPKITGDLPVHTIDIRKWPIPADVELADPMFHKRSRIDMLIGAQVFWDLIRERHISLRPDLPTLRETELGWIVGGSVSSRNQIKFRTFCNVTEEANLPEVLSRFWEIEGLDELQRCSTVSSEECLEHFQRTHERNEVGRFIVRLPFNERRHDLGDSREMATRRFLNLERRLNKDLDLKQQYAAFIHEYEQLGHMREVKVDKEEQAGTSYYIPHHCIIKPTSTTTKLRVVFDGSAKTTSGVSINDTLVVGPVVQTDLMAILLNFRCFKYVFTMDIPKMYRQVEVNPEDTKFQRILWRDTETQPIRIFELQTVTYGLASSPFQATMALKQLAADHELECPGAARILRNCFYIDDALAGAHSIDEALRLQRELTELLRRGCFEAHKWCTNYPPILEGVPEERKGTALHVADIDSTSVVKTLGVAWQPIDDYFSFAVLPNVIEAQEKLTRRKVLSEAAKIFDPLGLIGPVLTAAKLILREVASLNTDWDDLVPDEIARRWRTFRDDLPVLNELQLPRWIFGNDLVTVELHGFSDSSDQAYGACLYTRILRTDGSIEMKLICSKSRLLPKASGKSKPLTTPRSELLAAVLLSRLADKVLASIDTAFASVTLWSDSQIVLAWIRKSPNELQLFISNRVKEIQSLTLNFRWCYIPTDMNPADTISRGEQPRKMLGKDLWWNGPARLKKFEPYAIDPPVISDDEIPELKKGVSLALMTCQRVRIFDDMSDFSKVRCYLAYLIRFGKFIMSRRKLVTKGPLTPWELLRAEKTVVRIIQAESFQEELTALNEDRDARHRLRGLNAFIDKEDGILRVGGRIKHALIPYDSRHQMIMPAKHQITEALIRHLHIKNLHLGQRALLAVLRQRFWPLNAKSTIRKVIRSCIVCFKANPVRTAKLMGDLPSYRVQPAPVFAKTGVDFAGPFQIKSTNEARKPMVTKGYVSLFVCMSTRAIHLELVSSLSTEAFLAALRRFVSRRGLITHMYSDNATNFVGTDSELAELGRLFEDEHHRKVVQQFCSNNGIEWRFIPPRSPHFGGIWEAGVKSVKYHLKRIVGNRRLTYEELYTTLTQIEAVLNSRPLTQCSDDPNDYTAITPAHFLIGREMQAIPEPSYLNLKESSLSRWQLVQSMQQHFWKRWMDEYLPELQNRQKWYKVTKIKQGALVLMVDRNAPPTQWQLARIAVLHPGKDNVTRVVTLRTPKGEFKRAVTEICLLPLSQDEQPEELK